MSAVPFFMYMKCLFFFYLRRFQKCITSQAFVYLEHDALFIMSLNEIINGWENDNPLKLQVLSSSLRSSLFMHQHSALYHFIVCMPFYPVTTPTHKSSWWAWISSAELKSFSSHVVEELDFDARAGGCSDLLG